MMDPKLWEAWLDFSASALKGTDDARKAFESLAGGPIDSDAWARWMGQWFPEGRTGSEDMAELLEEWWRALGVVPRSHYEEVLRQNQKLRDHIAQAEKTIADLRKLLSREVAEQSRQQAEEVLKNWESTAQELLETQADLARQWAEGIFGKATKGEK